MNQKLVVFGDVHLRWQAMKLILDYAREHEIDTALTLGDEGHKMYPLETGRQEDYDRMWHELRVFRDEKPGRGLIMTIGEKTAAVAPDLRVHFVGFDETSKRIVGSMVYQSGNILAAHNGQLIQKEHGELIRRYSGLEPLVIFHGHSHSLGVLPEYKWLEEDEFVGWLENGEERYPLQLRTVYWVNPGSQFTRTSDGRMAANFATYDPPTRVVTLKTILYDERAVRPSPAQTKK